MTDNKGIPEGTDSITSAIWHLDSRKAPTIREIDTLDELRNTDAVVYLYNETRLIDTFTIPVIDYSTAMVNNGKLSIDYHYPEGEILKLSTANAMKILSKYTDKATLKGLEYGTDKKTIDRGYILFLKGNIRYLGKHLWSTVFITCLENSGVDTLPFLKDNDTSWYNSVLDIRSGR